MDRKVLTFIALAVTIVFGGVVALVDGESRQTIAIAGGTVVALVWVAVSFFGSNDSPRE